jgi:peptidyl-prolyl cis-trans isomerase C
MALLSGAILLSACSRGGLGPSATGPLASGEVARVGSETLSASLVADVARAQGLNARAAATELVDDALTAGVARSLGMAEQPGIRFACTTALARKVLRELAASARNLGPPTDNEVSALTVVHAIVLRVGSASDEARLGLALAIRQAVRGSTSPEDFVARAAAVPHAGMMVKIERVPNFGADGAMLGGGGVDASFVAAAFALQSTNDISPVIESPFGWHVMRLVERVAPPPGSIEERRHDLADAVLSMRARGALDALLRDRRQKTEVSVAPEAVALTAMFTSQP